MDRMLKWNCGTQGLSAWVTALLTGLVRRLLQPAHESVVLASVTDLSRSQAELVAENVLLRQPLAILKRQAKRPHVSAVDRGGSVVAAVLRSDGEDLAAGVVDRAARYPLTLALASPRLP